ncbi:hypothetical protein Dimus_019209 [Dionaea muscipula]
MVCAVSMCVYVGDEDGGVDLVVAGVVWWPAVRRGCCCSVVSGGGGWSGDRRFGGLVVVSRWWCVWMTVRSVCVLMEDEGCLTVYVCRVCVYVWCVIFEDEEDMCVCDCVYD